MADMHVSRRALLQSSGAALAAVTGVVGGAAVAASPAFASGDTIVVRWNDAMIDCIRQDSSGPGPWARALAILHTCIYDAWAAYDTLANGTRYGGALRRPLLERTAANKTKAISYAAHRACVDLYPSCKPQLDAFMSSLGFDPNLNPTDTTSPAGVGCSAAAALLAYRHADGSNQLSGYADYTGYLPVNQPMVVAQPFDPATLPNPDQWQPLTFVDLYGHTVTPGYVTPHWGNVKTFAMPTGSIHRSLTGAAKYGTQAFINQSVDILNRSANLTDRQKALVSYWPDGPATVQPPPPAHWCNFAKFVSQRDQHTLDQDAKMFFAVTNAMFDASIGIWDNKRAFNSVRPISGIRKLFNGQQVSAWAGPGLGTQLIDGGTWKPYKPAHFPTPPFPAFSSGHSGFATAAAEVMKSFTGSDNFGFSVVIPAGSCVAEPGFAPANDVLLYWQTFSDAAEESGQSRLYGGVHYPDDHTASSTLGRLAGTEVWLKAQLYFLGLA